MELQFPEEGRKGELSECSVGLVRKENLKKRLSLLQFSLNFMML